MAETAEFFWFYQASTCGGSAPYLYNLQRTYGADYLAGESELGGTDFTLLKNHEASPGGTVYLGWTAADSVTGPVACISHPEGDSKKICFGSQPVTAGKYWEVGWTIGTTEVGSSGGPLLNGERKVIGQLWGGDSDCYGGTDIFGKFSETYSAVRQWLDPELPDTDSILFMVPWGRKAN